MASILTQAQFDLLGIINGGWLPLTTNPPLGNGTVNNDDILITNLIAGLIVSGMAGNDRITIANSPLGLLNTSNGGAGSDQIFGNNGVNVINGGADNDYIVGPGHRYARWWHGHRHAEL